MCGQDIVSFKGQHEGSNYMSFPSHFSVKVHRLMCWELNNFTERISKKFLAIDSARPRSRTGLQVLCSLHASLDKAKLVIQHCSESSKLYLAITGDKVLTRCERIRDKWESSLRQIQNMVPSLLAEEISKIVEDLQVVIFTVEASEHEAGRVMLELLRQDIAASASINMVEIKALQVVALRLNLTTPLSILIEKRSIKGLLGKINNTDPAKVRVLSYFFYLLKKYGESIGGHVSEYNHNQDETFSKPCIEPGSLDPPQEFKCPLSRRMMFNPVIIASGETFEKVWIEKWFQVGHDTCPQTCIKLSDLSMTPNATLKDLISNWSSQQGITISELSVQDNSKRLLLPKYSGVSSMASLKSSINRLRLQTSNVSFLSSTTNNTILQVDADVNYCIDFDLFKVSTSVNSHSSEYEIHGTSLSVITKLSELPWESQCKAVVDVMSQLKESLDSCLMISTSYTKPLIKFLKRAQELYDTEAQRNGAKLLLIILKTGRNEVPFLHEEAIYVLSTLLETEVAEIVLGIFELLSCQESYRAEVMAPCILPSILGFLESKIGPLHLPSLRVLGNISANSCVGQHMIYLDYVSKLEPFWSDRVLSGYCIKIVNNLSKVEDFLAEFDVSDLCFSSIAELLESGSVEDKENAIDVLLSFCHDNRDFCKRVSDNEGMISSLVTISACGRTGGTAARLLGFL